MVPCEKTGDGSATCQQQTCVCDTEAAPGRHLDQMKNYLKRFCGIPGHKAPLRRPLCEIAWSWLGAFTGIFAIYQLNALLPLSEIDNLYIIGSFGATAVLIYGAPMADFSQPRSMVLGHLVSALTGVVIHKIFPGNIAIAGALAVSLSIAFMHLCNALHPPGGATARH